MKRRTDILSVVARLRREKALAPLRAAQESLAQTLDSLDAMGALDALRARRYSRLLSGGPKAMSGLDPSVWVGVLLWHRPSGYHGFRVLTLLGVWALPGDPGQPPIIAGGARQIPYARDFFDVEAYTRLMPRDFTVYYPDDGHPPARDAWRFSFTVDAASRLDQRALLAASLASLA